MDQIHENDQSERDPDGRQRPGVDVEPVTNPITDGRGPQPELCTAVDGAGERGWEGS